MAQVTIDTRFFRAGVGTVIYNNKNEVAFFERAQNPIGVWEFQQGGIDLEEDPITTLWRELKEEIGLEEKDIEKISEMPAWLATPYTSALNDKTSSRIGQVHKWYFLRLKDEASIDLSKATVEEASDYKFVDFDAAIALTNDHRKGVYQQLQKFFDSELT